MKITILGEVISKKNSRIPVKIGKRIINIPSKAYKAYEKQALLQLEDEFPWDRRYPVIVETFFYRKTLRTFDFDNMQASINDVLVTAGIIEDDSMNHIIPKIKDRGWEKDKDNPRVQIEIYEYTPS